MARESRKRREKIKKLEKGEISLQYGMIVKIKKTSQQCRIVEKVTNILYELESLEGEEMGDYSIYEIDFDTHHF